MNRSLRLFVVIKGATTTTTKTNQLIKPALVNSRLEFLPAPSTQLDLALPTTHEQRRICVRQKGRMEKHRPNETICSTHVTPIPRKWHSASFTCTRTTTNIYFKFTIYLHWVHWWVASICPSQPHTTVTWHFQLISIFTDHFTLTYRFYYS